MTFRQLKYFSTIYECKSLAKASQKLYISQQGLSRILSSLESEVGPLFTRLHHGLEATLLGTMLYSACQPVLREMNELEKAVYDFSHTVSQQVDIGLIGGTRYLNTINVRQIWQNSILPSYPNARFEAKDLTYAQGMELFKEGKLDLITYSDYDVTDGWSKIDLGTWHRVLLVPKGHPLYGASQVSPKVLKGEHLVIYTNTYAKQKLLQYCNENDCQPAEIVQQSDTLYMYDTCQKEVYLGITIQDYYTRPLLPQFPELKAIPFTENFLPYTVSALFRSDHPMADILIALSDELKTFFISYVN